MLRFECDYTEGAHPRILEALIKTNREQQPGYGLDPYCERARKIIQLACGNEEMSVHFLVGGTQTNMIVISAALRPHQAVISADTGHIAEHETGAIEATGHKVIALPSPDGKLTAEQVRTKVEGHRKDVTREHQPQPAMVYISHPTETGLIYTKSELAALRKVCNALELPLFLDGARLGYALGSAENDVFMADLAELCDAFYIGGTKVGALCGEALCITNSALAQDFRYHIKQRGGMLAKGRLLGIQFDTLLSDGLYFKICHRAVEQALSLRQAFMDKGVAMWGNSFTNQQFPILTAAQMEHLSQCGYVYEVWGPADAGRTIVRFCTSWATQPENIEKLSADIKAM